MEKVIKFKRPFPSHEEHKGKDENPGKKAKVSKQQFQLTDFSFFRRNSLFGEGKIDKSEIKIACWNVNGLKGIIAKGYLQEYLAKYKPDILCFNETKISAERIVKEQYANYFPSEYKLFFNSCKETDTYSGTGICTSFKPMNIMNGIGITEHDQEGRVVTAEFETFFLVAVYVPFSGSALKRLEYRTKSWDPAFLAHLKKLKKRNKNIVVVGDLNVAHQFIDLFEPERAKNRIAGFTDGERENLSLLLKEGFVDTFRELHPWVVKYTAWDQRISGGRKDNKGWRLDYALVNKEWMPAIKDSKILDDVMGSDHCPVEVTLNPNFK